MGVESGWPIVRQILCRVGCHVFTFTTYDTSGQPLDPESLRCDCGALTYQPAQPEGRRA
jgi:hypothetical protein